MTKEQIIEQYSYYENSSFFIECAYEALEARKEKVIRYFIKSHFMNYKVCDYDCMRKNAAYWNNIAYDKLNNYDFLNYMHSLATCANYRMIAKTMEQYVEPYKEDING